MPVGYRLRTGARDNDENLVKLVKTWLNGLRPTLKLNGTGVYDHATKVAVTAFQVANHIEPANGVVGIRTWDELSSKVWNVPPTNFIAPLVAFPWPLFHMTGITPWLFRMMFQHNTVVGGPSIDQDLFIEFYKEEAKMDPDLGGLSTGAATNLKELLGFFGNDGNLVDCRWAAYMMGTVRRECGANWVPVKEGNGENMPYGQEQRVECPPGSGRFKMNRYYGRGYVQVTHKGNYENIDTQFGLNGDLVCNPDQLITNHQLSYNVMSWGMRTGQFRHESHRAPGTPGHPGRLIVGPGFQLDMFFNATTTDWIHARNMINGGLDHADQIARWAKLFNSILHATVEN